MDLKEYQRLKLRRRELEQTPENEATPEALAELKEINEKIAASPPTLGQAYGSIGLRKEPD